jgi:hypothetical protein
MKQSLVDLLKTQSGNGKLPIGYTVSEYKGVLDSLEKYKDGMGEVRRVMGIERSDFSGVSTASYDKNGMSINLDQPVWKMNLDVTGSCVVQRGTSYEIVKFPNENEEYSTKLGNNNLLPMKLDRNISNNLPKDLKFSVGAFVDLGNMALEYFNKYYVSQGEYFTADKLAKLISSGCVSAQIIFPEKNDFKIVKVIGQTSIPKTACCYITTPILGTNDWQDCGIIVKIRENDKEKHDFLPTGGTMIFPL